MFSVACFIQGATLLTEFIMGTTKQDTWIAVLAAYLTTLSILLLYLFFIKYYPGKTMVEINDEVFGPVAGKLFSAVTIYFLMSHAWLNTMEVSSFFGTYLMPETPAVAFSVLFIFVCGWAVSKGVETLTRYASLLVSSAFAILIVNGLFLLDNPCIQFSAGFIAALRKICAVCPHN